jgi:hypothetical protein
MIMAFAFGWLVLRILARRRPVAWCTVNLAWGLPFSLAVSSLVLLFYLVHWQFGKVAALLSTLISAALLLPLRWLRAW